MRLSGVRDAIAVTLPMHVHAPVRGAAEVAFGSIIMGTIGYWVHRLGGMPLPALLAWRFVLGAILVVGVLAAVPAWRPSLRVPHGARRFVVALGALMLLVDIAFFATIPHLGVGISSVLLYTAPLFVAVYATVALRERPTRFVLGGMLAGFAGVILLSRPESGTGLLNVWLLTGLTSGAAWGAWIVVSRAAGGRGVRGEAQGSLALAVAGAIVAPVAILVGPAAPAATADGAGSMTALALTGLGILFVARGLRSIGASRAAVIGYVEPATAVALGAILLNEVFGAREGLGCFLVLAGALAVTLADTRNG